MEETQLFSQQSDPNPIHSGSMKSLARFLVKRRESNAINQRNLRLSGPAENSSPLEEKGKD
jgi:hypothetical protein